MTKPTPEQFDLTTETVAFLTQEKALRDKLHGKWSLAIGFGIAIIGAIRFAVSTQPSSVFDILFGGVFLIFMGCTSGLLLALVAYALTLFIPDPPRYKPLKRFQEAVAQYEAWFIRTQQDFWDRLTGRGFEIEVTNLLNRAGYRARLTPASGDGGVDIVLGDGTIVQCKAHRAPASPGVVRELYGTLTHQNAPKALLISRSGVTNGVHSFIQGKPITVWDTANLIALQKGLDE